MKKILECVPNSGKLEVEST